jgi:hypothetical protein
MGNNRDWSRSRVGRIGCFDRPAWMRIPAGRKGWYSWVANAVEVKAVRWRAVRI